MRVYYNEFDKKKCAALSQLMKDGHIRKGDIDDRSIRDVQPADVSEYDRAHFFAGIGLWDYALDLARWPADRPVWTGSCPCQPWGVAGAVHGRNKQEEDERDLWPVWGKLIPKGITIFGEQVATKHALRWYDRLADDLENKNYTVRTEIKTGISEGIPQRRWRLYFAAHPGGEGMERLVKAGSAREAGSRGWRGKKDLQSICKSPFTPGERWPQPLVRSLDDGYPERVGIIHAAGDAIIPQVAARFIQAVI